MNIEIFEDIILNTVLIVFSNIGVPGFGLL